METAFLDPVSTLQMPEVCIAVKAISTIPAKGLESDRRTEARAKAVFQNHSHLKRQSDLIQCAYKNKCLQLSGVLPSFYLKQLAQEALRSSCRDLRIENRIVVVNSQDECQS